MAARVRMTEEEAARRGLIPPLPPKEDKKVYIRVPVPGPVRYVSKMVYRNGFTFRHAICLIIGFLVGFYVALLAH